MKPLWERRYERQAAKRYWAMTRVTPLRRPDSHSVLDPAPDVTRRDRLAWWIANTALTLLASKSYRGRLRGAYTLGMYCRVAHTPQKLRQMRAAAHDVGWDSSEEYRRGGMVGSMTDPYGKNFNSTGGDQA